MSGNSFGGVKDRLLASLSPIEKSTLALLVTRNYEKQTDDPKCFEGNIGTKEIFSILHNELFGSYACNKPDMRDVMEKIKEVKLILQSKQAELVAKLKVNRTSPQPPPQAQKAATAPKKQEVRYEAPEQLWINNQLTGPVLVSRHAWERFCQKFCDRMLIRSGNDVVAAYIAKSFQKSIRTRLKLGHEAKRLMNNGGKPMIYLLDKSIRCRFVVSDESNKPRTLVTVEENT